jgi:hypothetical protein
MEDRINVHGRTVEDLFEPDGNPPCLKHSFKL